MRLRATQLHCGYALLLKKTGKKKRPVLYGPAT